MEAFFSGTDDDNENMTQFYAVWGKVADKEPHFAFRYVVGDTKQECDADVLIDWPTLEYSQTIITQTNMKLLGDTNMIDVHQTEVSKEDVEQVEMTMELVQGPFKQIDYPADWLTQHSKRAYTYGYSKNRVTTIPGQGTLPLNPPRRGEDLRKYDINYIDDYYDDIYGNPYGNLKQYKDGGHDATGNSFHDYNTLEDVNLPFDDRNDDYGQFGYGNPNHDMILIECPDSETPLTIGTENIIMSILSDLVAQNKDIKDFEA